VALVFLPMLMNDFVEWDDAALILINPRFNPPTIASMAWYWAHPFATLYQPLAVMIWGVLAKIGYVATPDQFGGHMNPYLFHLASLLLHAAAAVAVWRLLRHVVRNDWAAAAGALLWALHPVQVEAVAFAVGMNNLLFTGLAAIALVQYLCFTDLPAGKPPWRHYLIGTLAFAASMLCKPSCWIGRSIAGLWARRCVRRCLGSGWPYPALSGPGWCNPLPSIWRRFPCTCVRSSPLTQCSITQFISFGPWV
jgi:hypothetical protein